MQVPKPIRKRKPKKSKLQKRKEDEMSGYWLGKADSIFRRMMHRIWQNEGIHYCFICKTEGSTGKCQTVECAHLISEKNYVHRWNKDNVIPLGSDHHKFNVDISSHQGQVKFGIWLAKHFPEKAKFVEMNKEIITRKNELGFTFKDKYFELLEEANKLGMEK